jgi:hypothetical protein
MPLRGKTRSAFGGAGPIIFAGRSGQDREILGLVRRDFPASGDGEAFEEHPLEA